jgi:AcrR family transcriptional regulator
VESRRTPGQRAGLSREQVLAAARAQLADRGLAGLTMRALAQRLGVAPNALYSHVPDKAHLLEELLDDALAAVSSPAADGDWRTGLCELMTATHEVLLASPDLVPLYLGRGARGANAQRLGAAMTALLVRGGITGTEAQEALRVLIVYAIGFAAFEVQPGPEDADPAARSAGLAGTFDRGLGWLLTGIAAAGPGSGR